METKTKGKVVSAAKQWWLKVNTKMVRLHPMDGALFPYIIKVEYEAGGQVFARRKWINPGAKVPAIGSSVTVYYDESRPKRARIEI